MRLNKLYQISPRRGGILAVKRVNSYYYRRQKKQEKKLHQISYIRYPLEEGVFWLSKGSILITIADRKNKRKSETK